MLDPMRAIALILIGAFAIDRVVAGLFFLLSYSDDLRRTLDPDSVSDPDKKAEAVRNYRLIYALVGGYLGTVVMAGYMNIRLFGSTLATESELFGKYPLLDVFLTDLVRFDVVLFRLNRSLSPRVVSRVHATSFSCKV